MRNFKIIILAIGLICIAYGAKAQNEKIVKFYDSKQGSGYHSISQGTALIGDSIMVFEMSSADHGRELWRTNGTEQGTYLIKDINPTFDYYDSPRSSSPEYFYTMGDYVYFRAGDGVHGIELWRTDGTEQGTTMVKDIYEGATGGLNPCSPIFCEYKGELYFSAKGSRASGLELWKTDGTADGTVLVKDINTEDKGSSSPHNFVLLNKLLYFIADSEYDKSEIWYTDGTTQGTHLLSALHANQAPAPNELIVVNDRIVFSGREDGKTVLWATDGTSVGTMKIKDVNPYEFKDMVILNNELYFKGEEISAGRELWKTDGTAGGTVLVKDINPGMDTYNSRPYSSDPNFLTTFNNKVFFSARSEDKGNELWVSDGTGEGTELYADIRPESDASSPRNLIAYNNRLFFSANQSYFDVRLYSIGKTANETPVTHEALDFSFGDRVTFSNMYVINNKLCFQAELENSTGFELYQLNNETSTSVAQETLKSIGIYPNPAQDRLNLTIEESEFSVRIYDMGGEMELCVNNTKTIDISHLSAGIYTLTVFVPKSNYSTRFIKK